MRSCLIIALLLTTFQPAVASSRDVYIVLHSHPVGTSIEAGTLYRDGEFIYVSDESRLVLLAESGTRYLVDGPAAIPAEAAKLEPYRIVSDGEQNVRLVDRLFGAEPEGFIASGRQGDRGHTDMEDKIKRLSSDLLPEYARGVSFCLFEDELVLERNDATGFDYARIQFQDIDRVTNWKPGEYILRIKDLPVKAVGTVTIETSTETTELTLLRADQLLKQKELVQLAAQLAIRNCSIQAMVAADLAERK